MSAAPVRVEHTVFESSISPPAKSLTWRRREWAKANRRSPSLERFFHRDACSLGSCHDDNMPYKALETMATLPATPAGSVAPCASIDNLEPKPLVERLRINMNDLDALRPWKHLLKTQRKRSAPPPTCLPFCRPVRRTNFDSTEMLTPCQLDLLSRTPLQPPHRSLQPAHSGRLAFCASCAEAK